METAVGTLAEGTIQVMGKAPGTTETILGTVTEVTATTATIEGMIISMLVPGELPVEVELPATIRLPIEAVTALT